jgi:hypothetical protein
MNKREGDKKVTKFFTFFLNMGEKVKGKAEIILKRIIDRSEF